MHTSTPLIPSKPLTCRELCLWTEERLLDNLVQLLRQPLKHGRYSNNHVFEKGCLHVERAVAVRLDPSHDEIGLVATQQSGSSGSGLGGDFGVKDTTDAE